MRILRLDLKAYGPFTERHLDLSLGNHGIHLIYGANEAGKSSSLRAITDLLFGIPQRTPDNFLHPYSKLRLAAHLQHSDGSILKFFRRKTQKNSVFDEHDSQPVDDLVLARFLGNVDRDMFHFMFGIDHQRLREGGEKIVKGDGQIGELLFSAGAGISDLRSAQKQLLQECEFLLKSSGRSGAIVEDIKEYKTNRDAVKQAQVTAETWNQHQDRLKAAEQRKELLVEKIQHSQAEKNRLVRIRAANSAILLWEKTKRDLAAISQAPRLPEDFEQKCNQLLLDHRGSLQQKSSAATALETLEKDLVGIFIPENILRHSDAIESLRERLGSYRMALAERPKLETKLEASENEVKEILRELGRAPDLSKIEELRIPREKKSGIQDLSNQKEVILERVKSSRRYCEKVRSAITQCDTEMGQLQSLPDTTSLQQALESIQAGRDWESQLVSLRAEIDGLHENTVVELSQLGLFTGTLVEFETSAFPSLATIECFSDELKDNDIEGKNVLARRAEKDREHRQLCDSLEELELRRRVPSEEELQQARQRRDAGWKSILSSLQYGTDLLTDSNNSSKPEPSTGLICEAFQNSIEEADQIADQLRMDAERVARKTKLLFDIAQCESNIKKLSDEHHLILQQREAILARWNELWDSLPISPRSPMEMRDWRHRQERLADQLRLLRQKSIEERSIQLRIDEMVCDLQTILNSVFGDRIDTNSSLKELIRIASHQLDVSSKAAQQREKLFDKRRTLREELADAQRLADEAESDLKLWEKNWASELESLGLSIEASPSQANRMIQDITLLFERFRESAQVRIQLEGKNREALEFAEDVRALVSQTLPELGSQSPENAITSLSTHLKQAIAAEDNRRRLIEQIALHREGLARATESLSHAQNALDEMCRQAACKSYDQLTEAAKLSRERISLERRSEELEQFINEHRGGVDFETFVEEVEKERLDLDSIEPRIMELERRVEALNEERDSILGTIREATIELEKIDGSSKASELNLNCEGIAARMEERVRELAGLRMATTILHAAIEAYREKNQGPVLWRASQIFSQITNEKFSRLQADFDEHGSPVLTGVRAGNEEKVLICSMSDGTCDQLYLALRLATIENWLDQHEPLPLIVDDILLNFDDDRAIATLQTLAHLSDKTQVIFFTHHQHLVELANQTLSKDQLFTTYL